MKISHRMSLIGILLMLFLLVFFMAGCKVQEQLTIKAKDWRPVHRDYSAKIAKWHDTDSLKRTPEWEAQEHIFWYFTIVGHLTLVSLPFTHTTAPF